MRKILVVVELAGTELDDSAFEMATAARALGDGQNQVIAALMGKDVGGLGEELGRWCEDVFVFDDVQLAVPDGDVSCALLAPFVAREQPFLTLMAHTNNGMDLAPALAVKAGVPLLTDCLAIELTDGGLSAVRTVHGGKLHARVSAAGSDAGYMATLRPGAFSAAAAAPDIGGAVHAETVSAGLAPSRRYVETITPEPGAVDISQSELLVAVGRGIEEEENLEIINSLAEALGADVACSRPVVDKKWLPRSHQVGTSGVTVKPKVYLAIGISGSFQHMGGIKGGPFIAAINKDAAAPIFGVADVGIVGDLFDLVPLLEEKVRELKG